MNLLELGLFLIMASTVILFSREIGRHFAIPEALVVPAIIGIFCLLLRVFTRIHPRTLVYFSALLLAVSLVSIGLAKTMALREPILISPVSTGLILLAIRGAQLARRRLKAQDTNKTI